MNLYADATSALGWEITSQVGGYKHTGHSKIIGKTLCVKSVLLLQLQLQLLETTTGNERRYFSTVTTSPSVVLCKNACVVFTLTHCDTHKNTHSHMRVIYCCVMVTHCLRVTLHLHEWLEL